MNFECNWDSVAAMFCQLLDFRDKGRKSGLNCFGSSSIPVEARFARQGENGRHTRGLQMIYFLYDFYRSVTRKMHSLKIWNENILEKESQKALFFFLHRQGFFYQFWKQFCIIWYSSSKLIPRIMSCEVFWWNHSLMVGHLHLFFIYSQPSDQHHLISLQLEQNKFWLQLARVKVKMHEGWEWNCYSNNSSNSYSHMFSSLL